jgi:hypothetical protein
VLIGLALLAFQVANPFTPPPPAQVVNETRVVNEVHVMAPPPDPEVIAESTVTSSRAMLTMVIAPPPVQWANELLNLPDIWRRTPPDLTYNHPAIKERSGLMYGAALGLIALAVLVAGISRALGSEHFEWRIVYATVLALGSLVWWQVGIDLNNAICNLINAPDLPSLIRPNLTIPDPTDEAGAVILTLVYAIIALMLLASLLFRLGMLMILIAIGPLALFCFATPQSEGLAHKYVSLSVGLLFSQVLIVLGLSLAQVLNSLGTGLAGTLLSMIVLLLLPKVPGLLSSGMQSGGRGMVSTIASMAIFRRLRFR